MGEESAATAESEAAGSRQKRGKEAGARRGIGGVASKKPRSVCQEHMQGVRGLGHLPAKKEQMQGVRGGEHLPAPAHQEPMQGVRGVEPARTSAGGAIVRSAGASICQHCVTL